MSEGPNYEAVTSFAEAHLLFGFFSFIIYIFIIVIIRLFKVGSQNQNFELAISSVFLVYLFYRYLLGFGVDYWLFGYVLYPFIFLKASLAFIKLKDFSEIPTEIKLKKIARP
jgi:hypothetical protein